MFAIERVSTMQLFVREAFVWLTSRSPFPQMAQIDDAENHQWATQSLHACNNTCTTKRENLIENIGVVPAKYPSKAKLESFRNSKVPELESIMRTCFLKVFGFL